ncbi:unnamed protein product [Withania somnifera]
MEYPFYGNYCSQPSRPSYSSNMRGIPVQSIHQTTPLPKTKVVQIPVQFINTDSGRSALVSMVQKPEPERSGSALRIQKVFRGFMVRRSVKRIMSIRKEVDDVERKLLCRETGELTCRDERERLRVNETLMSLLLKLDSIRGVDSGIRECRKAVIRKVLSLQEKVDSIVLATNQITVEEENQYNDSVELPEPANQMRDIPNCTNPSEPCDLLERSLNVENQAASNYSTNDEKTLDEEGELVVAPLVEKCEVVQEVKEEETKCPMGECGDVIQGFDDENETRMERVDEGDESRRNRELLEKMVEKSEKMMRMMNELCHRNELQTRMVNSLALRVDQLEKAFVCDRLKRKNKKRRHPA